MLPALLQESGSTSRLQRMRDQLGVVVPVVALCAVGLAACGGAERQDADEPEGEFPVAITAAEFPAKQSLAETNDLLLSVQNTGDEALPNLAVTIFTVADAETASEADPSASEADSASEEDLAKQVDQQLQEELNQAAAEESGETEASGTETTAGEEQGLSVADGAFAVISDQPGLAIPSRPVWILEQGFPRLAATEPGPGPPGELAEGSGATAAQTNTFSFGAVEPDESIDMVWRVTPVQAGTYTIFYRVAAGLQGNAVAVTEDGGDPEGEFVVQITNAPPQTRVNDAGEVVPITPDDTVGQAGGAEQQSELDEDAQLNP